MKNTIMKYFGFAHLPEKLQAVSRPIGEFESVNCFSIIDSLTDG